VAADRARSADMPPISADDILDMHEFLDSFDGDFKDLFSG
jgi:hypothetical protein